MGWVEGVVTVLTGWAWPIVVLIAVLVLRREIGKLIARLTRFSGAGVEAEFGEQVEAASELAEAISPETPAELPPAAGGTDGSPLVQEPTLVDLTAEADVHPVGGMVRAWNLVEARAARLADGPSSGVGMRNFRQLAVRGVISGDLYGLAERLAALRNRVVHGDAIPTRAEAKEFVSAAWRLASELSRTEPARE